MLSQRLRKCQVLDGFCAFQAWLQPIILGGGVQLGAKHQEDSHIAPKALRQGSGGALPLLNLECLRHEDLNIQ